MKAQEKIDGQLQLEDQLSRNEFRQAHNMLEEDPSLTIPESAITAIVTKFDTYSDEQKKDAVDFLDANATKITTTSLLLSATFNRAERQTLLESGLLTLAGDKGHHRFLTHMVVLGVGRGDKEFLENVGALVAHKGSEEELKQLLDAGVQTSGNIRKAALENPKVSLKFSQQYLGVKPIVEETPSYSHEQVMSEAETLKPGTDKRSSSGPSAPPLEMFKFPEAPTDELTAADMNLFKPGNGETQSIELPHLKELLKGKTTESQPKLPTHKGYANLNKLLKQGEGQNGQATAPSTQIENQEKRVEQEEKALKTAKPKLSRLRALLPLKKKTHPAPAIQKDHKQQVVLALQSGDAQALDRALQSWENEFVNNNKRSIPLRQKVKEAREEVSYKLLEGNPDFNPIDTALTKKNSRDLIEKLLKYPIPIQDKHVETALKSRKYVTAALLVEHQTPPNADHVEKIRQHGLEKAGKKIRDIYDNLSGTIYPAHITQALNRRVTPYIKMACIRSKDFPIPAISISNLSQTLNPESHIFISVCDEYLKGFLPKKPFSLSTEDKHSENKKKMLQGAVERQQVCQVESAVGLGITVDQGLIIRTALPSLISKALDGDEIDGPVAVSKEMQIFKALLTGFYKEHGVDSLEARKLRETLLKSSTLNHRVAERQRQIVPSNIQRAVYDMKNTFITAESNVSGERKKWRDDLQRDKIIDVIQGHGLGKLV